MLILAYHRVNREVRDGLSVSPAMLCAQLKSLLQRGWVNVVLDESLDSGEVDAPRKSFAVTFDDGYQDNYLHGAPVLESLGIRATVFLVSDMIDTNQPFPWLKSDAESLDAEDMHMTTSQLCDGLDRGVFIYGSHTRTHPFLSQLNSDRAWTEIHDSKVELEKHLGVEIRTFCYPAGDFNGQTVELVREAGYQAAVVTPNRYIPETMHTLHRVGVYSHITPALFRAKTGSLFSSVQRLRSFWWARKRLNPTPVSTRSETTL